MRGKPYVQWTCDRCGATETTSTDRPLAWRVLIPPQATRRSSLEGVQQFDICRSCDAAFDAWWDAYPKRTEDG